MKTRLLAALLCLFGIGALSACANTDSTSPSSSDADNGGPVDSSGLTVSTNTLATADDIDEIRFEVTSCPGEGSVSETETRALEEMTLPGGIDKFESAGPHGPGFDEDSEHLFADAFFTLDQGCYDVTTQPLDANDDPVCQPATRENVDVEDGATTEILLINQCEGAQRGGLDVISAINHPPTIKDLEIDKFLGQCPADDDLEQVCVTAKDPDGDPLEFVWEATADEQYQGDIQQAGPPESLGNNKYRSCATVRTNQAGAYGFEVTVYDLDGDGNRMEDALADQDDQNSTESRDSLSFPMYSGEDCQGRMATILMAIGDHISVDGPNSIDRAEQFIEQATAWASPLSDKDDTDVIYVLDDNNQGEHLNQDRIRVTDVLDANFDLIDEIEESGSIDSSDLEDADLVWFANPGWPVDDAGSRTALRQFAEAGGGVVVEGNDAGRQNMDYFHRLDFDDNGTTTCGDLTDNNSGNPYQVEYTEEPHPSVEGFEGFDFEYDNDIDHVNYLGVGTILADASYSSGACSYGGPAAVAVSPLDLL